MFTVGTASVVAGYVRPVGVLSPESRRQAGVSELADGRAVQAQEINDDEGRRLLRIVRRGTGSVVT